MPKKRVISGKGVLRAFADWRYCTLIARVTPGGRPTARISRRRDARGYFAGKVRQKSMGNGGPDEIDGKCTFTRDITQAPIYSERGAVDGRLHALVSRAIG